MTQPVITAAARVRELALDATSFTGTSAAPPSMFVTQVAGLYTTGTSTLSMADLVAAADLPAHPRPVTTPVDVAVQALTQCTSRLLLALARGGAASELLPLIDPYVAALEKVEVLWRNAIAAKHSLSTLPHPAREPELPPTGGSQLNYLAQWDAQDEARARRKRGVSPQAMMPVTSVDCAWCGATAGRRHDSVECVTAETEHLIAPAPSPVEVPRTRYVARAPRRSRRRAERPHHLVERASAEAPTPTTRKHTVQSRTQSCASCQRPISPMGHCGC